MTDHTKHRSSFKPWVLGFPFPRAPEAMGDPPRHESSQGAWLLGIRCRLHRGAIDRELAAGTDPSSSACRHRRATQLTDMIERRRLAAAYERLLSRVDESPRLTVAPMNWRGIRASAPRLARLVARLREEPQVRPQGVARAELLLTDGGSLLYAPQNELRLVDEVRSILALL